MAPLPLISTSTLVDHTDMLQRHVIVRILQIPLIIDEPVIAGGIAVDVPVRTGGES